MSKPQLKALLHRYQQLIDISEDLASTLNLETLLDRIVHVAADLCSAEAASILLYNEYNHQLFFEAATNLEIPFMRGLMVPVDTSIAGWIIMHRQPLIINDAQKDPRHFKHIGEVTNLQTNSLLGVPMITKDKVIGVLEAINKVSGQFSQEDQELLMALGSQAAVAIENARLFQQSDLISELVHELRTPLTSLSAASHLLQRPELGEELRNTIIQTIQTEITRLLDMSNAYLDLARLESGRTLYHITQVDIGELLEECAHVIKGKVVEKGINLQLKLPHGSSATYGDSDKLKQVILNLLSNAIKYTPTDGVITLSGERLEGEIVIRVSDNGMGIPQESLPLIFEKFYRVPGAEYPIQGTGLGLFISKRIIQDHQGKIEVRSKVGDGTEFILHLPSVKS